MYVREWNNMQYASAAAFLLAVYSDHLSAANAKLNCPDGQIQPQQLFDFAKSQVHKHKQHFFRFNLVTCQCPNSFHTSNIFFLFTEKYVSFLPLMPQADYILGKNPNSMSYLVGYGPKYPVHVHHRGSSIASVYNLHSPVGCVQGFETWYRRNEGNPNVLHGALVGGPDQNDKFTDDRSNYEQTEPTLTACAPLVGLFSKLQGSSKTSGMAVCLLVRTWNILPYLKIETILTGLPLQNYHRIPS